MKKIFILLIAIAYSFAIFSQSQPSYYLTIKDYNPSIATPEAASFIKYGDIPVSEYTGTPDISIPIYTINEGDIHLPITLRYHASGIKVEEQASCVGLGWNLDAGGVITKAIVGREDNSSEWLDYNKALFANSNLLESNNYLAARTDDWRLDIDAREVADARLNGMDTYMHSVTGYYQPDMYNFSFLNYSGKFYIDIRDNSIHIINDKSNVLFQVITGGFKAIDTNGVTYYFTKEEYVANNSLNRASSRSYYMTKIEYPNQQVVDFVYTTGSALVHTDLRRTECFEAVPNASLKQSISYINYQPVVLDCIKTKNCSIVFSSTFDRTDIIGERRLNTIKVYNATGTNLFHTYSFTYDYFKSNLYTESVLDEYTVPADVLRLKLSAFNVDNQTYKFSYNPIQLPSKRSVSIDYWGYYNGATNHICANPSAQLLTYKYSALPDIEPFLCYDSSYLGFNEDGSYRGEGVGANRGTDPDKMKACILSKIEYPTGGTTEYFFEPHSFSNYIYIDSKTQKSNLGAKVSGGDYTTKNMISSPMPIDYSVTAKVSVNIGISNSLNALLSYQDLDAMITGSYVSLLKDGVVIYNYTRDNLTTKTVSSTDNQGRTVYNYSISGTKELDLTLQPGTYTVVASIPSGCKTQTAGAGIGVSFYPKGKKSIGAGLRVAKIVSTPVPGTLDKAITKSYKYEDENQSFGKLMAPLRYYQVDQVVNGVTFVHGGNCDVNRTYFRGWRLTDQSSIDMCGDANGSLVGYDKVTILQNETTENGKVEKYFRNTPSDQYPGITFLSIPSIPHLDNGLLKSELCYNKNGDLIVKHDYDYSKSVYGINDKYYTKPYFGLVGSDNWVGPAIFLCPTETIQTNYALYSDRYNVQMYAIRSEKWNLASETTNEFFPSGTATTTKSYEYNSFGLKSKESVVVNSGKKLISSYKYASDYDFNFSIINDGVNTPAENMKVMAEQKYMLSKPVEVLSKAEIDGAEYVTGGDLISYGDKFKPEKVFKLELKDPLLTTSFEPSKISGNSFSMSPLYQTEKLKIQYTLNSNVSDIFDYQKGFSTSYLWGYNNIYPIARIENGSASQVAYTSFEEGVTAGWDVGATLITNVGPTICGKKNCALSGATILSPVLQPGTYWVDLQVSSMGAGKLSINGSYPYSTSGNTAPFRAQCTLSVAGRISLSGDAGSGMFIDEVRIYPVDAQMSTYTYDPLVGMTSQTDPNGTVTRYEYDSLGRLQRIKDTNGNILKEMEYNYAHY